MNDEILVSIIIPAYNVEKYIRRGIDSCVGQTYRNIEIVLIDDGSTDQTWEIIQNYQEYEHRIYAIQQNNSGVSAARNRGLQLANGQYVLFLDSDDWLEYDTVQCLVEIAKENQEFLICSEAYFAEIKDDGTIVREQQGKDRNNESLLREQALLCIGKPNSFRLQSSCYKLFDKKIIEEQGLYFDEELHHGEDGLFTFEYLRCAKGIVYTAQPFWNILNRPGSATTSPYNSKWLGAITAAEKMLAYKDNSVAVSNNLHYFLLERTLSTAIECIRSGHLQEKELQLFRNILRNNIEYAREQNVTLKRWLQYYFLMYAPKVILEIVLKR